MKFVFGLLLSLACSLGAIAQQQHFVFIQTENRQPFYVQMDSTIYSSYISGYIILAQLPDSSYSVTIGFPKSEWLPQHFSFTINNNDLGYMLRYTDKWVLADLQTGKTIEPSATNIAAVASDTRTDPFANMLANVVNDPTIKQKMITEETGNYNGVDSAKNNKTNNTGQRSTITKISSRKVSGGTEIVYTDGYNDELDTIKIILPAVKKSRVAKLQTNPIADTSAAGLPPDIQQVQPVATTDNKPVKKKEEKFLDMSVTPNDTVDSVAKPVIVQSAPVIKPSHIDTAQQVVITTAAPAVVTKKDTVSAAPHAMVNSECTNPATQEDFIKLRKKMANQKSDNDMLAVAKKVFRTRCFTTEQIKNLGALFFSDQGRYAFFESAYEVVADAQNYEMLKGELSDPIYVNRFEALIHH